MFEKAKQLLRDPIWQGISVLVALFLYCISVARIRKGFLDIISKAFLLVEKQIPSPLAQYSTILFILSLIGLFLFRHETKRVKAVLIFLLFFAVAGFAFSVLNPFNYPIPKGSILISTGQKQEKVALEEKLLVSEQTIRQKTSENSFLRQENEKLKAQIEAQKQQINSYGNILSQKDNENTTVNQERDKLGKDLQNQKQQIKMYSDTVLQKDKEISSLKQQLTDSSAEETKLQSRVATLEKENRQLQVEKENLKNSAKPLQLSFELVGGKLFLVERDKKREILTPTYSIVEYSQSKSGKKFAAILFTPQGSGNFYMMVSNADHDLSYRSLWTIYGVVNYYPPKNLKWVSDTMLRLYLYEYSTLKLDDTPLKGTGNYEFNFDEINSFVSYKKLNIGG